MRKVAATPKTPSAPFSTVAAVTAPMPSPSDDKECWWEAEIKVKLSCFVADLPLLRLLLAKRRNCLRSVPPPLIVSIFFVFNLIVLITSVLNFMYLFYLLI